jgi:hypothetical protein
MARADEQARQARIKEGMGSIDTTFKQFDDSYFKKREEAYMADAKPKIADQAQQVSQNLAYNLARSGMTDSSEKTRNVAEINKQLDSARIEARNKALESTQLARNQIESERADLVGQLNMTGDAQAAAQGALSRASIQANQPTTSALGQLFSNTTGLLGGANQAGMMDRNAPGLRAFGFEKSTIGGMGGKERTVKT